MAALSSTELRVTRAEGGDIAWLEAGQGPSIVLLHGIGSSACSWSGVMDALSPRFRVIAWNAPGYPPSAHFPSDAPAATVYAQRLAALLDELGVRRTHVVGHSLGCLIAARFANIRPERVASLTLASCALGHARLEPAVRERLLVSRIRDVEQLGPRGMAEKRGPCLLGPLASPDCAAAVIETMAKVDPRGYAQAARMLSRGDLIADLGSLGAEIPVQFVYGSADVITPPDANLRAAAARPGAPVTVLHDAGHACYVEQPAQFSRALEEFARQHG